MEKKKRGSYVDGAYVIPQEEPVIVKIVGAKRPQTDNKDKK